MKTIEKREVNLLDQCVVRQVQEKKSGDDASLEEENLSY